ncbi:PAS domain S-box protein [Bacillus sp. ISL-35]|uniref:PAS domain-containing protein n=1 Tax=Bacillus sp. ISL-35 TaxID=2819122 RepID=UPI001BECE646|nr:PAS domain-containing sensor histidine kinase [Bacillus sp. ISL-35]MBT2679332.1 PAS domain S-box protein [Bacillus sp. ISL-35]MBT2703231.1 PAS domain S-box protein [Chryseobacterium sp. ISL-80]
MKTVVNEPSLFEHMFKNLAFPVLIYEIADENLREYRIFEVNEAACTLLKYSKEELLSREVLSLYSHLTPKALGTVKELLFTDGKICTVLDLPDRHEKMITVEVNASLMSIGNQSFIFCMLKEFSTRHCHHDALEEENHYLRTVIDTTQSFVLILDKDGRINNWNQYTERMSGYSLEEVQYKKFWDFFIDNMEKQRIVKNYLSGKIPTEYENFWRMKNGEKRFIKWKSKTVEDPEGNIQFVLATGVDITDTVLSFKELEKSREKYKALVSSMQDIVITIDTSFKITSVHGKWIKSNGFNSEVFEGKSVHDLFNDSRIQQEVQRALSGKSAEIEWDIEINGKSHYFHSVLSPIILNNNVIKEVVGVTRDITEKKNLEEHHKRIYEALTSGMILQDTTGKIVYANKNASEILGYSEQVLVNMTSLNVEWDAENGSGDPFKGEEHPAMKTLETGEEFSNIEMFVFNPRKDEKRWILVDTRAIYEAGSSNKIEYVLSTFHDITEKKEMDQIMQQSQKLALIGRLASGVVHEIRNPLTSIMGLLKFVEEGQDQNKIFDYLPVMKMELEQINRFTNEFIELSYSNEYNWTVADIDSIIRYSVNSLQSEIADHNIKTLIENNCNKNLLVKCIEPHLKLLFINLFKNSIEAMPYGGSLTAKMECMEDKVLVSVIDTGKGISPERLKHLCEPYYSTKEKGTGLGLMRSLKVVHDHNGKIDFSSEEGKGTVVTIELPLN